MTKENSCILSIYIATFNRRDTILKKVKRLLSIPSTGFDVWILDDCSDDGTYEALRTITDDRLHLLRNKIRQGPLEDGVMPNWFKLAESCDGQFCFHLNDRDHISLDGLQRLIQFLKKNPNLKGGVCNLRKGYKIYSSNKAFEKIPYAASHPTGIVFNVDAFHKIKNRDLFYAKRMCYIHPHDLVLSRLCTMGAMFTFEKIWQLADQQSFKKNKSFLYNKGNIRTVWFSPDEKFKEYNLFLKDLDKISYPDKLKRKKIYRMSEQYLFYSTIDYDNFLKDPGQMAHYGLEVQKGLSFVDQNREKKQFIKKSLDVLMNKEKVIINPFWYKLRMNSYFYSRYFLRPIWCKFKELLLRL